METCHIKSNKLNMRLFLIILVIITTCALTILMTVLSKINTIIIIATIVMMTIGLLIITKFTAAPDISFTLTFMHCQFHSKYGGWTAQWKNITQIAPLTISSQGWNTSLPWIGIRLNDYRPFIMNICPRTASRILLEQRILVAMALKYQDDPQYELDDILFDDTPFISDDGYTFKGLQAMLANRMYYNRELLGYDYFISEDLLDRPINDFVGLLRRYKAAA